MAQVFLCEGVMLSVPVTPVEHREVDHVLELVGERAREHALPRTLRQAQRRGRRRRRGLRRAPTPRRMTRFDGSPELLLYPRDESPAHAGVWRVGFDPAQVI